MTVLSEAEAGARQTASAGGRPAPVLDDLCVLYLPKNSRVEYFSALLQLAKRDHAWRINVLCAPGAEKLWSAVVGPDGSLHAVPDFTVAQAWENDAAAVEEIDRFIASCETATGVSAGRIVLAGERDLGRGFSEATYHWFRTRLAQRVLADTSEPFRIVRRMFAFARETLRAADPDLILAGEWADPLCFCFNLAARQMGISCAVNRPSKLWSGRCYWSADPLMYNTATKKRAAALCAANASVSKRAQEKLSEFRARPKTLGFVQDNWKFADRAESWKAIHRQFVQHAWVGLRHRLLRRKGQPPKPALKLIWWQYRRMFLKWRQATFFRRFDDKVLREIRYLLISLHKDPEQALNFQAPFWSSQYNTVSLLTSVLPAGYRLLVREHRNNAGRRPTAYYKDISRLPNVTLIDGFDDQFRYIANADLVVTDNGSTGWEALMLGRPVVTLAESFYDAAGLDHRLRDPDRLAARVVDILCRAPEAASPSKDDALGWLLDAEWENSAEMSEAGNREALELLAHVYAAQRNLHPAVSTA